MEKEDGQSVSETHQSSMMGFAFGSTPSYARLDTTPEHIILSEGITFGYPAMAVSVKLDEKLRARLQHLAAARRRSAHWIMREAIQQYVEREEARESFREEAEASWRDYQASGLHLTGEEVRKWLSSWGSDSETEAPDCHK